MSINSVSFLFFLPTVVLINFMLPRKYRYIWLFLASYFFYLSNDMRAGFGLVFCTFTTYIAGVLIEKKNGVIKKAVLALCVLVNIFVLLFLRNSFIQLNVVTIGISFYMLQAAGYVIDVYRNQITAEKNLLKYAVFVSFFPTVASGPIQRGTGLLQQIKEGRDFDYDKAHTGLYYLLWGYLLKLVMADKLSVMVDFVYKDYSTMPGATLLWAIIIYAVQLYCDFAGYSALAIGAGKILGFDLKENFSQPYFAVSVKDFWNRWHISLSSWLRDYIYIP
ncbi:MAG: MBOAT family protein, partial [Lachnospiraceae bacterium]|nr:MBOAT family protein [Lachnospiraceae bacterium]